MTATPRRVVRRLLRAPMFTLIAVFTLALGIGANTAIFSVVRGVLLKPLPFDDADRLVGLWHTAPGLGIPLLNMAPSYYFTYREEGRVFEDVGLWNGGAVSVTGTGEPERVQVLFVTDGTLSLLHINPILGRHFTKDDDSPKTPERVLLSHAYWERKFGSDQGVLGKSVVVDGKPREIIGVLPAGFRFLDRNPQLIMPFRFDRPKLHAANFSYRGVARLKPGVTMEQANAEVGRLIPLIPDRFPMPPGFTRKMLDDVKIGPNVRPLSADVIGDVGRVLWVLLGTVGLVLLIACANVANLFLVRAEARQQELAIHAALGAGSRRIAWELLSESMTLALAGGVVGLGLAYAGIRTLVANAPDGLPRAAEIGIDPLVLLFTLGISVLAGLLFGLLPVMKFATPHLASALKEGGRASSAGRDRHRARNGLVVAEIALAVVLLVASGLMIRTFQAMRDVNPGFVRPEEVITLRVSIPDSIVADDEQAIRTHEQIVRKLEQIPGVRSVGVSNSITMDGFDSNDPIFVEDFPPAADKIPPLRRFKFTAQNYFQTMGNPIIAGREMTWADVYSHASVAIVSENFAREYWKEPAAAIGKRIRQTPSNPWRTIIGVVGNERDNGISSPASLDRLLAAPHRQLLGRQGVCAAQRGLRPENGTGRVTNAAQGDPAGGVERERQPSARQRAHARPDSRRVDGADVVRTRDARYRGSGRAPPGCRRHLRCHRLRRAAADERDWHPHGARRRQRRRQLAFRAPRHHPRGHRHRLRHGRGGRPDADDVSAALWRQRLRSADVWRCRSRARWHSGYRELPPGAPRVESGSRRSVEVGGVVR